MILSFSNQKGGVGKTTTTLNIGVYLAKQNKRVLLVDLDPQANLTSGLGYSIRQIENSDSEIDFSSQNDVKKKKSIYEVLIGESNIEETYISTRIENLFIVPSCIELAGAEIDLVSMMNREGLLKKALKNVKSQFDFILIDCPPSLGLITINALTASDKVIVPVQCEYYALEGLGQLLDTIKLVKNNLNSSLDVGGIILTMFDSRTKLSEQVVAEVRNYFKGKAFDTIIPRNIRLSESPSHGLSISEYEPSSTGAKSYEKLAIEFLERFDIN